MKKISFSTDVLPLKNELFRLALRITLNKADAEDVVQETMIKVWNRREQWEQIESMEAFCITICRNLALDHQKRMENQNVSLEEEVTVTSHLSATASPEEHAVQRDKVERVRRLMDQLPEKQRTCMQLRDVEGKAYKDIAAVMGITEQQVKINIFRARQTIKQEYSKLEKYGL
jgi:RNA polymerase sigma-70 factor (ECF subfamily)